MLRYRLSEAAQGDVINILAWTHEQFGGLLGYVTRA
jgi:plasmid stabilization system protein ParE